MGDFGDRINEVGDIATDNDGNALPPRPSQVGHLTDMRRRSELAKQPRPDIFRGTTLENARLWKTRMHDYLDHYHPDCNETGRLQVIKMFQLTDQQRAAQEDFWTEFDAHYLGQGSQYALQQLLPSRKQQPGESMEIYTHDIQLLISRNQQLGKSMEIYTLN